MIDKIVDATMIVIVVRHCMDAAAVIVVVAAVTVGLGFAVAASTGDTDSGLPKDYLRQSVHPEKALLENWAFPTLDLLYYSDLLDLMMVLVDLR